MPRTPAVFEAKRRWKLEYDPSPVQATWAGNYPSAREHNDIIKQEAQNDIERKVAYKISLGEAKKKWGEGNKCLRDTEPEEGLGHLELPEAALLFRTAGVRG